MQLHRNVRCNMPHILCSIVQVSVVPVHVTNRGKWCFCHPLSPSYYLFVLVHEQLMLNLSQLSGRKLSFDDTPPENKKMCLKSGGVVYMQGWLICEKMRYVTVICGGQKEKLSQIGSSRELLGFRLLVWHQRLFDRTVSSEENGHSLCFLPDWPRWAHLWSLLAFTNWFHRLLLARSRASY